VTGKELQKNQKTTTTLKKLILVTTRELYLFSDAYLKNLGVSEVSGG
jgi:hypothetical protein